MAKNKLPIIGQKEYRAFTMPDLLTIPEGNILTGHAAVFNTIVNIGDMWEEIIEPTAFTNTDFRDVLFSVNHDLDDIPLARSRNNNANSTLQLQVDEQGLAVRATLDISNNNTAKALYSSIQRGDINGMSFIFCVRGEQWENLDGEMPIRYITDIAKVIEVSAVSFPAYDNTDINARSVDGLDSLKQTLDNARVLYNDKNNKLVNEEKRKTLILQTF